MPALSPTYATPGLRTGLLLLDHPQAAWTFSKVQGKDLPDPLPDGYGADKWFCLCVIEFNDGNPSRYGWKPVAEGGSPDEWNTTCTKTLGRALKRAGYPDDMKDLKALVLWRQRSAEIMAIAQGEAQLSLPPASAREVAGNKDEVVQALNAAAVPPPQDAPVDETDRVDQRETLRELVESLDPIDRDAFDHYAGQMGVAVPISDDITAADIERCLGWFDADAEND